MGTWKSFLGKRNMFQNFPCSSSGCSFLGISPPPKKKKKHPQKTRRSLNVLQQKMPGVPSIFRVEKQVFPNFPKWSKCPQLPRQESHDKAPSWDQGVFFFYRIDIKLAYLAVMAKRLKLFGITLFVGKISRSNFYFRELVWEFFIGFDLFKGILANPAFLPSMKLTAKAPENGVPQKESSFPTIHFQELC